MIPVIKTKERFGKFAGKEKYQGVLQHVRLYFIYGFHLSSTYKCNFLGADNKQ